MGFKKNNIGRNYHRIILLILFILQAGFTRCYLPVSEWFSEDAIYTDDYSLHYADALYKCICLSRHNMVFAYNPYIRAGSISNIFFSVDNFGWSLFVYLLSFLPSGFSFKLYFIISLMSVPFLLYWGSKNFDLNRKEASICSVLGTLFLHASICVDFIYWGTVSYILSCYLSLLIISFFYRFVQHRRTADIVWFTLFFSAGFWVHIFTAIHVLIPCTACYIFYFRKLSLKQHALIGLSSAVVFLLNSIWLIPCLIFMVDYANLVRDNFIYATPNLSEPLNTYFFLNIKFNEYMNIPFMKSGIVDLILLCSGIIGMAAWKKNGHSLKPALFAVMAGFFFLLAYYGSFWDFTASLTPLRFVIYMNLCLTFPAAAGLCRLYDLFLRDKEIKVKVISSIVLFYLLGTILATPYQHLFLKKDFRLITRMPEPIEELTSWIRQNTTTEGRILIENSDFESSHQYYGTHLPYFFPLMTKREYIGNYSPYATSPDSFATFYWGYLFKKKIEQYTHDEVWPYMGLYNIKWVICWSDASRHFFETDHEHFSFVKKIDKFYIYAVNRKCSYFIKGQGKIKADINRLELTDLKSEDGKIIISYRWMKYLRSNPEININKTTLLSDPGGFITLINPPERLVVFNSYREVFSDWIRIIDLFKNRI